MKKIGFYLILVFGISVSTILILTSVFLFIYIKDLTNLYFKPENTSVQEKTISTQEIDQAIEKLRKFRIVQ